MNTPILREWYVMLCLAMNHLAVGFVLGFPAILSPALTGNYTNVSSYSEIHASREQASSIAAAYGMTGPIGFLILPALMQSYGRRFINIVLNVITFTGSVIIAASPDVINLMIGRSIQGLAFGGLYITSILAAEYSHPKHRGFFIVFKISASSLGILICHGLGFVWHWRNVAWLACLPPALAALGTLNWPESPSWLAYKGRYDDSAAAFEWLRGTNVDSKKELLELISVQKEMRKKANSNWKECLHAFRSSEFLKPFLILTILVILLQVCGRHYLMAYLVEIMTRLTGDKSKAFLYTICLDVMKTIAILMSCLIVRVVNRRSLLFVSGTVSCLLLGSMCLFHYLSDSRSSSSKWLTPILLILYSFSCHIGIIPLAIVLKGEMFPIKYRGLGTCCIGIIYSLLSMATLKLTSRMLATLDTHGTFGVYLVIAVLSLIVLYLILPETKDRTMQDIEMEFIHLKVRSDDCDIRILKRGT